MGGQIRAAAATLLIVACRSISNVNNLRSAPGWRLKHGCQPRPHHAVRVSADRYQALGIPARSPQAGRNISTLHCAPCPRSLGPKVECPKSVPVYAPVRFVPLLLLSLAVAPAPAGIDNSGCGGITILDPDIAMSFARFDATQSPQAARLCAAFFNNTPSRRGRPQ